MEAIKSSVMKMSIQPLTCLVVAIAGWIQARAAPGPDVTVRVVLPNQNQRPFHGMVEDGELLPKSDILES